MKTVYVVYVLVEIYVCDYERSVRTSVFAKKEDAIKALANARKKEIRNWDTDSKDVVISCEHSDYFDIYIDGFAAQNESEIYIVENEINFGC